jgi:hypothetical protein
MVRSKRIKLLVETNEKPSQTVVLVDSPLMVHSLCMLRTLRWNKLTERLPIKKTLDLVDLASIMSNNTEKRGKGSAVGWSNDPTCCRLIPDGRGKTVILCHILSTFNFYLMLTPSKTIEPIGNETLLRESV